MVEPTVLKTSLEAGSMTSSRSIWGIFAAQWVAVDAKGDVPAARDGSALAAFGQQLLLYGGRKYIYTSNGGWVYYSDLTLFDPSTGAWTAVTGITGTPPAGVYDFGAAAVVGCSVFYYGGYKASEPYRSGELMRYEADPAVTQCVVGNVATGTCNKQCDKIVADVEEIRNGTNVMIKFKLRHPDKV